MVVSPGELNLSSSPASASCSYDVGKIVFGPGGVVVAIHGPHDSFEQGQDAYCNAFLAIASGKK